MDKPPSWRAFDRHSAILLATRNRQLSLLTPEKIQTLTDKAILASKYAGELHLAELQKHLRLSRFISDIYHRR